MYLWKREPVFGLNAHLPLSLRKTRSSLCSLHSAVIMPLSVSWLICSCIILELTLEDAVKIYEEELGFDRVTARAQVQAHQNAPGYFTCYYYGMKKICDWEKEYGYTKWDYTELLFSAGRISMESLEMLVKMTKEEQGRFFTEFRSLLMDDGDLFV